mmetsp:Transcript_14633/g.49560  ORF Transcript_14633/g.49560 Transcript_14633/m.49560 type:complete len:205 (+) Transcript_14633:2-616(+)
MLLGFSTFGSGCLSNILLNYHAADPLAVGGRLATGLSILFGFPLTFVGLRDGVVGACRSLLQSVFDEKHVEDWTEAQLRRHNSPGRRFTRWLLQKNTEEQNQHAGAHTLRWMGSSSNNTPLTLLLLATVTAVAVSITDIGVIAGCTGAVLGASIVYVLPSLMYVKAMEQAAGGAPLPLSKRANVLLVPFGVALGVLGVIMTLQN